MTKALLVVDVQNDYLNNDNLVPSAEIVTEQIRVLLEDFRSRNLPIAHIRTAVVPGVADAMAHRRKSPRCVLGTDGYEPPEILQAAKGELIAHKQHFRGFTDPALDVFLSENSVDEVVIVGLYTHACIRETTLDAYERGLDVVLPVDALGSDAPGHAQETLEWIGKRAARLSSVSEVISENSVSAGKPADFSELDLLGQGFLSWRETTISQRKALLERWAEVISEKHAEFASAIANEVKKPQGLARGEVDRAIAHVNSAIELLRSLETDELVAPGVEVVAKPIGVIAALMPWNNPLALPVSKIAAALACGNTVAFKPSPLAQSVASLLIDSLDLAGLPQNLVRLILGGSETAKALARDRRINAVTVTGSIAAGRQLAMICAARNVPLQSELGGNNAAIIWTKDPSQSAEDIIENAFLYAGQRCTAPRRIIVPSELVPEFINSIQTVLNDFTMDSEVITRSAVARINGEIATAVAQGAKVLSGGTAEVPTVLLIDEPSNAGVQNESFGPVLVIQPAENLEKAIELANGVEQGLVLYFKTDDENDRIEIQRLADVGLIQNGLGVLPVHADAPFGGWKASGNSSPEHGRWDLSFYTKPQARYKN
jgi:acyl-CoA reductase-like NAD-dependent aldehyde dehydrogenase/nicotinamidase-related amidase